MDIFNVNIIFILAFNTDKTICFKNKMMKKLQE